MKNLLSFRFPLVAVASAAATILLLSLVAQKMRKKKREDNTILHSAQQKDILQQILERSAPTAAAEELDADKKAATCERRLNGRQLVITADAKVANYVFNGPKKGNYVRRPADDEGLGQLGMLNRGLIWNNDLHVWRKIRGCFQRALGEASLRSAVATAKRECLKLLRDGTKNVSHVEDSIGTPLDLLNLSRRVTFRTTLYVFFGLESRDFESEGIEEGPFIDAIVAYFKAWEFFLFRPSHIWDAESVALHRSSVDALRKHVRLLLKAKPCMNRDGTDKIYVTSTTRQKNVLFIEQLRQASMEIERRDSTQLLEQGTLEMLLAGTDTSSVTAYYALLGLAGDESLQREVRDELASKSQKKALLDSLINETLRFKPVGPVVLREAVETDLDFPGIPMIEKGAAVLLHLAKMNLRKEYWHDPETFDPKRFLSGAMATQKIFFPFGEGPKGCIGMHLGRREVAAIVETVVLNYHMSIEGAETLKSLKTHWDIANQPDEPANILVREFK